MYDLLHNTIEIKPERHSTDTHGTNRVRTEAEQQIWNECSRLIANAVIYYQLGGIENA